MSTTNSTIQGRVRRLQLTKVGALLLLAAPTTAFSSGCSEVGLGTDAEGNLGQAEQALTTCVTLNATADAMLSDPPKSQNYGSHPLLRVGGKDQSLIRFDLSSIPAQGAINSATLKLYASGVSGSNQVNIHAANAAWNESTVSFQSFNQQFDGTVAAILNPATATTFKTADITSLVNAWRSGAKANNGLLLKRDGNQKVQFSSRDAGGGTEPTLTVCYTTADENHCAPNPCVNGTCTNTQNSYTCACDPGWTGTNCETNINECAGNPCQNGGVCTDGQNSYTCACAPGYSGANCETNINECASNPCQNGGVCTDGVNSYSCSCEPGYSGTNCETNIDDCAGAPCQNGGNCTDGSNSYTCACPPGYSGTNCETDIDDCAAAPCANGACIDGVNSYTCSCNPGFDGANCQNNIDECAGAPCLNGGTCNDGLLSYTCACAPGYTGTNCEIDINDCAANPCQNDGICVDGVNSYTCSCPAGYSGTNCETNIDDCEWSLCFNGATCVDNVNGFTCECTPGWTGTNCDEPFYDPCYFYPCQNNGTCSDDGYGGYTCSCPAGYSGTNCETNIDDCEWSPCFNGATCVDNVNGFTCECTPGWTGTNCDEPVNDPCWPNPCQNNGTCSDDGYGGYTCSCSSAAWSGPNCATSECPCADYPAWSQQAINGSYSCQFYGGGYGDGVTIAGDYAQWASVYGDPASGRFCTDWSTQTAVTEAQEAACRALLLERDAAGSNLCATCSDFPTATCSLTCFAEPITNSFGCE